MGHPHDQSGLSGNWCQGVLDLWKKPLPVILFGPLCDVDKDQAKNSKTCAHHHVK